MFREELLAKTPQQLCVSFAPAAKPILKPRRFDVQLNAMAPISAATAPSRISCNAIAINHLWGILSKPLISVDLSRKEHRF